MLSSYRLASAEEFLRALREVIQYLSLLGMWRSRYFERTAFCGGTALRIFHGLPRFSEDMDFSLLSPDRSFSLEPYLGSIRDELASFGFELDVVPGRKPAHRKIESAFLKTNALQCMLLIEAPARITDRMHRDARLKIKVEVDTDPPPRAEYEMRSLLLPVPFQVRLSAPSSLFAGKLHALLCRSWKSRIKGRDFFDFVWFIGKKVPCNLSHLRARMVQAGNLSESEAFGPARLADMLHKRFDAVNIREAAQEARPFVADPRAVDVWSPDFFHSLVDQLVVENKEAED